MAHPSRKVRSTSCSTAQAASAVGIPWEVPTAACLTTLQGVSDLVLLRHGESTWNALNLFTGWTDVDLSAKGEAEARQAGALLATEQREALDLQVVHTSVLTRAVRTANIALDEMGRSWLPCGRHWRLNERHYGALQGLDEKETAAKFGDAQVKQWRRSYDIPPPPLSRDDESHPVHDDRYRDLPRAVLPDSECLADVVVRMVPYWEDAVRGGPARLLGGAGSRSPTATRSGRW